MRPLCTVLLLLHAAPAAARFTPVLREDVAKLVKRRARVYVARDCRMDKIWYMPGDSFIATHRISVGGRYYDRGKIGCKGAGSKCEIGIWCLSKTPVDYSYRRKRLTVERFARDMLRDVPRLATRYMTLLRELRFGEISGTYSQNERKRRYHDHLKWIDTRLSYLYRAQPYTLRRLLQSRGGWLQTQPKHFIMQFVGKDRPKALKDLLFDAICITDAFLKYVIVGDWGVYWTRKKLAKLKVGDKYKKLRPDMRGELIAQDVAVYAKKIVKYKRNKARSLADIRKRLARNKIRARWK